MLRVEFLYYLLFTAIHRRIRGVIDITNPRWTSRLDDNNTGTIYLCTVHKTTRNLIWSHSVHLSRTGRSESQCRRPDGLVV